MDEINYDIMRYILDDEGSMSIEEDDEAADFDDLDGDIYLDDEEV